MVYSTAWSTLSYNAWSAVWSVEEPRVTSCELRHNTQGVRMFQYLRVYTILRVRDRDHVKLTVCMEIDR